MHTQPSDSVITGAAFNEYFPLPGNGKEIRQNSYQGIAPEIVKIVKRNAKKAIGKNGLRKHDLPDIEQELMTVTINAFRKYDCIKGSKGALAQVAAKSKLNSIFRHRQAIKRDWRQCALSLNEEIQQDGYGACEFMELVATDGLLGASCMEVRDPTAAFNLKLDVDTALERLPAKLRSLCEDLKFMTITEAAEKRKVARRVIYDDMQKIRDFIKTFNFFSKSGEKAGTNSSQRHNTSSRRTEHGWISCGVQKI